MYFMLVKIYAVNVYLIPRNAPLLFSKVCTAISLLHICPFSLHTQAQNFFSFVVKINVADADDSFIVLS
jgi:hypothetical protein